MSNFKIKYSPEGYRRHILQLKKKEKTLHLHSTRVSGVYN